MICPKCKNNTLYVTSFYTRGNEKRPFSATRYRRCGTCNYNCKTVERPVLKDFSEYCEACQQEIIAVCAERGKYIKEGELMQ